MSAPVPIKQAELTRYAKALKAAGVSEWQLVLEPDGRVRIVVGNGQELRPESDWDKVLM